MSANKKFNSATQHLHCQQAGHTNDLMFQLVLKHQFNGEHIQIYPCPAPQNSPMSTTQHAECIKSLTVISENDVPCVFAVSKIMVNISIQLGGVGHCCTWHVRVPSGLIGL